MFRVVANSLIKRSTRPNNMVTDLSIVPIALLCIPIQYKNVVKNVSSRIRNLFIEYIIEYIHINRIM